MVSTPSDESSAGTAPPEPGGADHARASSRSCSPTSNPRHTPFLTLAPNALPGNTYDQSSPEEELSVKNIWNVISRASEVVKDGSRLENLAWRHWGQPTHPRRPSSASSYTTDTASSASLHTPTVSTADGSLTRNRSFEKRSFTGTLKLLVEEDSFKDWIEEARRHRPTEEEQRGRNMPPTEATTAVSSQTQTPVQRSSLSAAPGVGMAGSREHVGLADVEIRLVEPTPVPSRVGSLKGSVGTRQSPSASRVHREGINEESEGESPATAPATTASPAAVAESVPTAVQMGIQRPRRKQNRFFIQPSPTKISDSDCSHNSVERATSQQDLPPESPAEVVPGPAPSRAVPRPAQSDGVSGSQGRSSGDSSSAIVMRPNKKPERRNVSMSNMRGRFQAEKRRAAEAINQRNNPEPEDEEDSEDWEDEDEGEAEEDWEDEPSTGPSTVDSPAATQPPVQDRQTSRLQAPPPRTPTPPKTKKERAAAKAKLDAERDAQRKREMFAKQQIFGAQKGQSEGLLTRTFRTGKSMVDLTEAGQEDDDTDGLRRAPTHTTLSDFARYGGITSPSPGFGHALVRSKSTAAMPVQSGVSVTAGGSHTSAGSEERRAPPDVEMESSDEESEDDTYLQTEHVRQKLDALAAKREKRVTIPQQPVTVTHDVEGLDENGVVRPISPTTRRRTIIMREMSESLRRNIILEREKSSGRANGFAHHRPPPSVQTSRLPTAQSAVNLTQHNQGQAPTHPMARQRSNNSAKDAKDGQATQDHLSTGKQQLERHSSQPNLADMPNHDGHTSPIAHNQSPSPVEQMRRKNVLGGGFLRPLTRTSTTDGNDRPLGRAQSTVALQTSPQGGLLNDRSPSPTASTGLANRLQTQFIAPAMQRSNTEDLERQKVRRELARKSDSTDTSYRMHGW